MKLMKLDISVTFSGHHHAGHGVRYTGSSSKQSKSHNSIGDSKGLTCINTMPTQGQITLPITSRYTVVQKY